MRISRRIDIAAFIAFPLLAFAVTVWSHTDLLLVSGTLFFIVPVAYLTVRNPGIVRKSFVFSLIYAVPMSVVVDSLAALNGAYIIPRSVFPFRVFGVSTVELYLFSFFWSLWAVMAYEHFFDHGRRTDRMSRRIRFFIAPFYAASLLVVVLLRTNVGWLAVPYCYAFIGTVFVVMPLALFLFRWPRFLPRMVLIALYTFYALLVYEIAALETHEWTFPGQFLGWVTVVGQGFPLEELVFWMVAATPALLAYYEFFADDRR